MQPRNKELEKEVLEWIFNVLGEPVPAGELEDILKNGVVLCNLINKIAPGSVKKIQAKGTNFQLMENIQRFQDAIKKYGVPQEEIFQTADLFERRNIPQVIERKKQQYNCLLNDINFFKGCAFVVRVGKDHAKASGIHGSNVRTENGGQERENVHGGTVAGARGPTEFANGLQ